MKPFWITFYSYKGGVGRSLALANMAALLVKRGRRVVLIDFDLEAPGLDSFSELSECVSKPGVVEYVAEFEKSNRAPDISNYVHSCVLEDEARGKLWVMPAGRKDAFYNQQRVNINWSKLYEEGWGIPFIENWKASIHEEFKPDYVLVDSRTGLTDVGGICTLHIPDLVVLLFGLNEQNIRGIASVAQVIRDSHALKTPQMLAIATPVPNLSKEDSGVLRERLKKASDLLKLEIKNQITYFPEAALVERLFVLDRGRIPSISEPEIQLKGSRSPSSPIEFEYNRILDECVKFNRNGIDFLIQKAKEACKSLNKERGLQVAELLKTEYPDRAEALYWTARIERILGRTEEAQTNARKSLEIELSFYPALQLLDELNADNARHMIKVLSGLIKTHKDADDSDLSVLHDKRGQLAMKVGEYKVAYESFRSMTSSHQKYLLILGELVDAFNLAEAERRVTKSVKRDRWLKVISLNDKQLRSEPARPLEMQANQQQAMHIAYACIGNLPAALQSLRESSIIADRLGELDEIYSVKKYDYVGKEEFLETNKEMLQALELGRLWDGMKVKAERMSTRSAAKVRLKEPRTKRSKGSDNAK